jgi:predicted phosphoadenosine phosphosulfate sulfurtransferase
MNVLEAAKKRLEIVFKDFDNVYVSFSGGKDSGVMLNFCVDFIRERKLKRKIGVFHIDYEAQYQSTTDYVDEVLESNRDIFEVYRICLPISAQCATSMHQHYWTPWDQDKKDLWVRPMPEVSVNEQNHEIDWFVKGMWDYEFQERFSFWYHKKKKAKRTACLVGIRTDESLNRWRAIHSDRNQNKYKKHEWTLEMYKNVYNVYPIFDWKTEDIWIANSKFNWRYNDIYNLFYKAGVPIGKMRVASPFNDAAIEALKLYRVIDPKNWGRMVGRVNGVNFAGIYGGTTAMGWKSIKLPPGHTWKSYMEFLLKSLPKETADGYRKKLAVSEEFWKTKGGALSDKTIAELKKAKVKIKTGKKTLRKTDKQVITMEYLDDSSVEDFKSVPTYKRMCVCILKNDHLCKYMGFGLSKTETEMRALAEKKYKNVLSNKGGNDE